MKKLVQNDQTVYRTSQSDHSNADQPTKKTNTFGETIRFGLVGVLNTAADFVVFLILTNLWKWNVLSAQTVSYLFGLINSYVWNRKVTFKSKRKSGSDEVIRFISLNLVSYLASIAFLTVMGHFPVSNVVSKVVLTFVTFVINFFGSKWWVFRQRSISKVSQH